MSRIEEDLELVKLLSDLTRFRILKMLQHRPAYVCELSYVLGLTMATVSAHLSKLKDFGVLDSEKCGNKVRYFLKELENPILKFFFALGENSELVVRDRKVLDSIELKKVCPVEEKSG